MPEYFWYTLYVVGVNDELFSIWKSAIGTVIFDPKVVIGLAFPATTAFSQFYFRRIFFCEIIAK